MAFFFANALYEQQAECSGDASPRPLQSLASISVLIAPLNRESRALSPRFVPKHRLAALGSARTVDVKLHSPTLADRKGGPRSVELMPAKETQRG